MKQKIKFSLMLFTILLFLITFTSCGDGGENSESNQDVSGTTLSDWEMENGFGPIKKKLHLMEIDKAMAEEGLNIFDSKCGSCHKLDERYVGPAQRDVLQRLTPEFFMNMVLNPEENVEKHPHTKEMLGKYMQKMTNQNINLQDARKLLEYFRVLDEELVKSQQ